MAADPQNLPDYVMKKMMRSIEKLKENTPLFVEKKLDVNIAKRLTLHEIETNLHSGITIQSAEITEDYLEIDKRSVLLQNSFPESQIFLSNNLASFFIESSSSSQIKTQTPIREKDNQDAKSLSLNP